jgi:hypothetical protein
MSLKQNDKKIKVWYPLLPIPLVGLLICLFYQLISLNQQYNFSSVPITIEISQLVGEIGLETGKISPKNFYIAASKTGTKYYYQNCSGLGRIKPENLTFFASESQAEGAGLSLAKNCKKP